MQDAPKGKLTDLREIIAYGLAHAAGIAWGMTVNPVIFRSLIAQGYRSNLPVLGLAMSVAASAVLLLLFLLLRRLMTEQAASLPPADRRAPAPRFTDLGEITAYVLAHAAGIAWAFIVNPMIFRHLAAQGHRTLVLPGLVMAIAIAVVVLLIFLFLRKAMAGPDRA